MDDALENWLCEQQGPVFFVKWPTESFFSAFALTPATQGSFAFFWADFHGNINNNFSIMHSKTFEIQLPKTPVVSQLTIKTDLSEAQKNHERLVALAIAAIENGEAEKIVVAREEVHTIQKIDPHTLFIRLCKKYPHAAVYWFHHPKNGETWLGASPELLLDGKNGKLTTVSLAGTRHAKETGSWGNKEQREQEVVTTYITQQLAAINCSAIQWEGPETVMAGPIAHLKTVITATAPENSSLLEAAKALHPTPAVSGLPQDAALQFIANHESFDREAYAGFFGLHNEASNSGLLYVNLRCMRIKNQELTLFAGGGINSASEPQAEWEETVAKLNTLKSVL